MNVAILGAGKIGKYHVREFTNLGAKVVAVLGSTKESSSRTTEELKKEFGVKVRPYYLLEKLLRNEDLDAISICTPPKMHKNQTRMCLEHGLHVMCEKPFIQNSKDNYKSARELLDLAENKKRILTINTQWVSVLGTFSKYIDIGHIKNLSIYMESGERGIRMLGDHLPHTNSLLVRLIPEGHMEDISFPLKRKDTVRIRFIYGNEKQTCDVNYNLRFNPNRPRKVIFSLNGKEFIRRVDKNYRQKFVHAGHGFSIEDPLKVSINRFIDAINSEREPLVGRREILENMLLTEQIIQKYTSCFHKPYKSK